MSTALTPLPAPPPTLAEAEIAAARGYAEASRAPATRRAYATDWRGFLRWCAERGLPPLPAAPEAVAVWLAAGAAAGAAPATLGRRLAAVGHAHRRAGYPPPQQSAGGGAIAEVMAGIRRARPARPLQKAAADADVVRDFLRAIAGDAPKDMRDRALIALGFAGALRRSELAALRVDDIVREPRGIRLLIRSSKTDQEGRGQEIAIPEGRRIRPVALLDAWLAQAGIVEGWLFPRPGRPERHLDPRSIARIVQRRAAAAGYDPARFGGHSLRAGFLTAAAANGSSIFKMKEVSRHRSTDVLAAYVRSADLFEKHAGENFL